MTSHKPSHTLQSVEAAFKQWRSSGTHRHRVPDELRQQAVSLLGFYKKNDILRAIGSNHSTLSRWLKELTTESAGNTEQANSTEFIALPIPSTEVSIDQSTEQTDSVLVSMVHPSGWTLQWHTFPNQQQLHQLLSSFQQLNNKELI